QDIEDRARVLAESRLRMARALRRVSTLESASAESRTRAANLMLLVGSVTAMVFSILLAVSLLRPLSSIRLAAMKLAEGRTDLEIRPGGGAELEAVGQALSDAGREIGRRMEAQSAAAEAQALARQVLDAQEHALIVLDRDLRVKMMNSSVYALRGQGFAVEVGCSLLEGLPEALQAGAEQRLQGALEGRVTRAKDELIIDASGQSRWYAATNVPLRDADGNIKGVVKSMLDVTSRKLHEMELTEARTRAEAGQAAKSRFLNNISHEMRTPLNGILGMAQVLDVGTLDIATREAIDLMHGSAERLLSMIDGVIEYSEMEHDHESYATEPYRIDTLLQEIQQQYAGETERSKTTLSVRSEIHTPLHLPVRALQAVLRELLENALRYAFGAPIEITAELVELAEGRQVKLTVADEGPGIGPEKRDTIFEAFVQGDSSRQKAEGGLGIGLARVRQIAERIGASVTLESEPGQGCAIALQFAAGFVEASTAPEPNRRPPTPKPDVRVLVAEDNPVNQKVAQRMLEQLGVTPEIVPNGEEAVRAVQRTSFDLVLMDLQMPVLDGLEATKQIRALLPLDDQPSIVALTANNRPADKRACSEVGMDAFLEKPVRRKDLVRVLEQFST
ncbi:MAG: response regulator, partial [Myxococcota bacterium]